MLPTELKADELRKRIMKTALLGKAGHITSSLSMVDIISVLYFGNILEHDPKHPEWENRDKFVLSKAHGGLGYYTLLAMEGYFPLKELDNYCKPGQHLGDHSNFIVAGVENSGGALGHGLGVGIGMALSAKLLNNKRLVYVVSGDGECQEGSIWESALYIGSHNLNNLVWIIDYNKLQAYSSVQAASSLEPIYDKLTAFGFDVKEVDGHNHSELFEVLKMNRENLPNKPRAIIAHTIKGYGVPLFEGKEGWHGKQPTNEEYEEIVRDWSMTLEELKNL